MGAVCSRETKSPDHRQLGIEPHLHRVTTRNSSPTGIPLARKEYSGPGSTSAHVKPPRLVPVSRASDPSKASFLDLPSEVRNDVYLRLLIVEDYVRLTPKLPTRVPALVLLRTCKQIHDEVASIFYAANSFYVNVEKNVKIMVGSKVKTEFPDLAAPYWTEPQPNCWGYGGLMFPSPRYHIYLTRLTIDAKIILSIFIPQPHRSQQHQYFPTAREREDDRIRDIPIVEELEKRLLDVYVGMRELWEAKDRVWEGKMAIMNGFPGNYSRRERPVLVSMNFSESEEEEVRTKGALRGNRQSVGADHKTAHAQY